MIFKIYNQFKVIFFCSVHALTTKSKEKPKWKIIIISFTGMPFPVRGFVYYYSLFAVTCNKKIRKRLPMVSVVSVYLLTCFYEALSSFLIPLSGETLKLFFFSRILLAYIFLSVTASWYIPTSKQVWYKRGLTSNKKITVCLPFSPFIYTTQKHFWSGYSFNSCKIWNVLAVISIVHSSFVWSDIPGDGSSVTSLVMDLEWHPWWWIWSDIPSGGSGVTPPVMDLEWHP